MHTHTHSPAFGARAAGFALAALAALGLALALVAGSPATALAHDELVGTAGELSEDGNRIDLTLQFNNEIMDIGAEITATDQDGEDLVIEAPVIDGRDVRLGLTNPGFDETVTVAWRVVSSDGHPISDLLAFAVVDHDGGSGVEFRDPAAAAGDGAEPAANGSEAAEDTVGTPSLSASPLAITLFAVGGAAVVVLVVVLFVRRARGGGPGGTPPAPGADPAGDAPRTGTDGGEVR